MTKPEDIASLDKRIKAFKTKKADKDQKALQEADSESAMTGFQMSIELVAGVFIGAAMGYFLDLLFDTRPILLCILTVLGGAAGVLNIYKSSHNIS